MITHDAPYIDRRILLEARALSRHGYDVSIVHPYGSPEEDFDGIGIRFVSVIDLNDKNLKNRLSRFKKTVRKLAPVSLHRFLKKVYFSLQGSSVIEYYDALLREAMAQKYDIYMAHDLPALPIAHAAAQHYGARLVYDAHEFYLGQSTIPPSRKAFLQELEARLIPDVDLMFTVNEDIAHLYESRYPIPPIEILYNAVDTVSDETPVDLHARLGIDRETKIILFQGGFIEGRNLDRLVESAQYLPDRIVIVMLGYAYLEQKLKKIARKTEVLGKKIFFLDRVPQKELIAYTAGADYGIIPYPDIDLNTQYCTPNKFFEFLSAGLPIIANERLVTVGNLLKKYNLGMTIPFDIPQAAAEGIVRAVETLNDDFLRQNSAKALEELSWDAQEKILLRAFEKLQ